MIYLLDANVLINASRDHYRFHVCPGFWDWVFRSHRASEVYSVSQVQAELLSPPELVTWAASLPATFFLPHDQSVLDAAGRLSVWATAQSFMAAAISEFLKSTDYWLIAHASAKGGTVVTHEISEPNRINKVKIPDACMGVGAACTNPYDMLQTLGACFELVSP